MLTQNSFQSDSRILREARSVAGSGLEVLLLALYDPGMTARVEDVGGFRVQRIAVWSRRIGTRWALGVKALEFLVRLTIVALRSRARIFHAHHPIALIPGAIAAKALGGKLIYDCHELAIAMPGDSSIRRWLIKEYESLLLRFVDRVIMSDGASRAAAFKKAHRYTEPITSIYNCPVEVDSVSGTKGLRNELGISPPGKLIAYTGVAGRSRGLDVALHSMPFWPSDAHFVMIGPRTDDEEIRLTRLAADLGLYGRVHFWGPVPPDEVPLWTADADLSLVLIQNAGLSYYYSAPTKMFESIMARVPQVSSDFPEIRRVVLENPVGPVGRVVDPADHKLVGRVINELLTDDAARLEYRRNADILARTTHNWEAQQKVLLDLYRSLSASTGA